MQGGICYNERLLTGRSNAKRAATLLSSLLLLLSFQSSTAFLSHGLSATISIQFSLDRPRFMTADSSISTTIVGEEEPTIQNVDYGIRDCVYAELGQCADVILNSFYNETIKAPLRPLFRMAELNRIQQNFPYADRDLHRMIIVQVDDQIVGFCDVDARRPNRQTSYRFNPRPYLSDLCIDPKFRRLGLAKALIRESEQFCRKLPRPLHSAQAEIPELFIRVERSNKAAVSMYREMGYTNVSNPDSPDGSILILHKHVS